MLVHSFLKCQARIYSQLWYYHPYIISNETYITCKEDQWRKESVDTLTISQTN